MTGRRSRVRETEGETGAEREAGGKGQELGRLFAEELYEGPSHC